MNNEKLKKEEILKKEKERQQEAEREAILMKADENTHETLELDFEGNIDFKNEVESLMLGPVDNPEEKYELYYKLIRRLLMDYLPRGEKFKQARGLIYEEKNTFLSGGHRIDEKGIGIKEALLIETGFHTNYQDSKAYLDNQKNLANKFMEVVAKHFGLEAR